MLCVIALLLFPLEIVGAVVVMAFRLPIAYPSLAFIGFVVLSACSGISSVEFQFRLGVLRTRVVLPVFMCALVAGALLGYAFVG